MAPSTSVSTRIERCARTALALAAFVAASPCASALVAQERSPDAASCTVVQVVDGDTLHVERQGVLEKLRLSCVDTEEKLSGRATFDPDKPQTVFGEECARWAQAFFAALGESGRARVRLAFHGGLEERDVYGRLLCHVILEDGRDFNLLLVELGKSPYFNKYGNCMLEHERLAAAQRRARDGELGLWDPEANRPATPGAPAARRDYARLLPWWDARAQAVDAYRAACVASPARCAGADRPAELARAAAACADGTEARVFGAIDRVFEEENGDRTVLFRTGDKERALRVSIPRELEDEHAALDLAGLSASFRQNYVWVSGRLERSGQSFRISSRGARAWRLAGPEPVFAPTPRSK